MRTTGSTMKPASAAPSPIALEPRIVAASDRRVARRWSPPDVPWLVAVHVSATPAELINVSTTGVLLRTHLRPQMQPLAIPPIGRDTGSLNRLAFQTDSGERVGTAGRVVRCRVAAIKNGSVLYDVAFRFDEPPGLELPEATAETVEAREAETGEDAPPLAGAEPAALEPEALLTDPLSLLRELESEAFPYLLGDLSSPTSARDAIAKLVAIEGMLAQIRATLRDVSRAGTDASLREIASRIAPSVPRLQALRADLLARVGRADAAHTVPIASASDLDDELRRWHSLWH